MKVQLCAEVLLATGGLLHSKQCFLKEASEITMNVAVFWDAAPCSTKDSDRCFRGNYCVQCWNDK